MLCPCRKIPVVCAFCEVTRTILSQPRRKRLIRPPGPEDARESVVSLCPTTIFHSGDHTSTWRGRSTTVQDQVPSGRRELSVRGRHRGSSLELYLRAMRRMPPSAVCLHRRAAVYCRAASWHCAAKQLFKTAIDQLDHKEWVASAGK